MTATEAGGVEGPCLKPEAQARVQTGAENGRAGKVVGLTASVAVRIQHHPSRAELLPRLLATLTAFSDVRVIPDPNPDGLIDPWRTHRACLEAMPSDATHLCVLQDDALPADNFHAKLCAALEQHPDTLISLFTPGFSYLAKQMREAHARHEQFTPLAVRAFVPLVAVLYPRAIIDGLLEWADARFNERNRRQLRGADDGIVALYCRQTRLQPLLIVPSIVQHDDGVGTIGKPHRRAGPHRRAALL
jgi:hypothetical protein